MVCLRHCEYCVPLVGAWQDVFPGCVANVARLRVACGARGQERHSHVRQSTAQLCQRFPRGVRCVRRFLGIEPGLANELHNVQQRIGGPVRLRVRGQDGRVHVCGFESPRLPL